MVLGVLLERCFERRGEGADETLISLARVLDRHYVTSRHPDAVPAGAPHEDDREVSEGYKCC